MTEGTGRSKMMDIWMILMVILVVGLLVVGLWMTGNALSYRIDEVNSRLKSESEMIQAKIGNMRDEMRLLLGKPAAATAPAAKEKAEPAKATEE